MGLSNEVSEECNIELGVIGNLVLVMFCQLFRLVDTGCIFVYLF